MISEEQHRQHLRGWLSYAFASEVFVVVSLTLFLPICLEQFARDNGYLLPERIQPCSAANLALPVEDIRCVVKIGWVWIDSASFSLYVYSISVALQALTVISMGGIADHPPHRKRLLLFFAFLGASAATLFLLLPSSFSLWFLAAPLAMLANVGFGASVVAMNAYIPMLARHSPEVVKVLTELNTISDSPTRMEFGDDSDEPALERNSASSPLLSSARPHSAEHTLSQTLQLRYNTILSTATSRISSNGIALGYSAGIVLLLVALIPVTLMKGSTFSLRLAIGLSGIWWGLFSIPAAMWLPSGAAVMNPAWADEERTSHGKWVLSTEIAAAWRRLGIMLRPSEIVKLRNTFRFLAAWFLLSDGFTTITSTALLFGKTTLHMKPTSLILIGILTPTSGIAGSLVWPILQRRWGWSNLKILVTLVIAASMIPAYGCLGFIPLFREGKIKFGGLTTEGEMFALAVYFGSVYGAFQSYARALYAEILPPGEEARWYGLFSITDKSSSFLGPLIVGLIADATGNIRYAFFFLVFMIALAVPVLGGVDVVKGRAAAEVYSKLRDNGVSAEDGM